MNSRTGPILTRGDHPTTEVRSIGPDLYFDALRHMRAMPRISSDTGRVTGSVAAGPFDPFAATPGNALGTWSNLGPNNQGGRTRALIIHPTTPDVMYAGGVAGGVWKTTDGGTSWSTNTDQMANLAVVTLAFDPSNLNTIYAGTGEGFGNIDAIRGAGIFRSTDAGESWSQVASTNVSSFHFTNKILVSRRGGMLRIYAATGQGLFRSIDGGASFTQLLNTSAVGGCTDMAMQTAPASTGYVFVSCGRTSAQGTIYRGLDSDSSTFTSIMSLAGQGRSSIAVAPSNEAVVYVMASQRNAGAGPGQYGLHGIYRSTNNGDSFTTQRQGNVAPGSTAVEIQQLMLTNPVFAMLTECGFGTSQNLNQGWYDNVLAVDPADENRVWAGGIDLWRSDNGGVDWGVASYWWFGKTDPQYAHADQHGLVFHPGYNGTSNRILYATNDGGIQRTENARAAVSGALTAICGTPPANAVSWSDRSGGMVTTQFYDGAVYPDGATYFGGLQDNGTLRGFLGNPNWSILAGGDGGYVAVDTNGAGTADDVLFLENTGRSIQRSTDGGATFTNVSGTITGSGFLFIAPFTMATANRDELWTGGFDIWRTTNQATSWARATGASSTCGAGSISAIGVHPLDGNRVLVGMSDGCFHYNHAALSAPNTGTWPGGGTLATGTTVGLGLISWMTWDPTNINIAYAAVSAFGVNNLFKSVDGGVTWSPSVGAGATALPQIPVLTVAVNPNFPQQVFVGTDLGVFTSIDGGASWYVENTGFAKTPVESLKFDQAGNFLYAFTHGRGAWRTRVCNNCNLYTVGGTVSGLAAGNDVVLRNNGLDDLTVAANGVFVFPEPLQDGTTYSVTVRTQPTTPDQVCTVTNGSGTLAGSNITNVAVNCTASSFTVGGSVSGLAAGNIVELQNNGGDTLALAADGAFTFPTSVSNGAPYNVTVLTQPTTPNQTCVVTSGSGTISGANVTNVAVTCTTSSYTIGGSVSGLAAGNAVTLRNNGGDDLVVGANGGFTFNTPVTDGGLYNVTVQVQPTTPNQTCVVGSGTGTVTGANVANVTVTCATNLYTVGGTVGGLSGTMVLRNNGGDDLALAASGNFTFPTPVSDGSNYAVTVATQPAGQTCSVINGTGTVSGANVTGVVVSCSVDVYSVGGTVSGLAPGNSVILRNNGGDDLSVPADGSFTFNTLVANGGTYAVTVSVQPTTPSQTCVVTNGTGTVSGANVTNVVVTCTTNAYTVGGTVAGLAAGNSVVLRNNGGDDLTVPANGNFTFATAIADEGAYAVTVLTQPTTPNQVCSVTAGSGVLAGANVTNVSVACVTLTYTVGGTVSGLAAGNSVTLRNNGGDDLVVSANGIFAFPTALADGSFYSVTVQAQPTTPNQTCVVAVSSGQIVGDNITSVFVTCTTNTYSIGGTISGLAAGATVTLLDNGGDALVVNANGAFTFATALADGSSYAVTVGTQPDAAFQQQCLVSNGTGAVAGANVGSVTVTCLPNGIFANGFE